MGCGSNYVYGINRHDESNLHPINWFATLQVLTDTLLIDNLHMRSFLQQKVLLSD